MREPEGERLNKFVARSGLCSRRAAAEVIATGRVTINGQVVTEKGWHVQDGDDVRVDGIAARPERLVYLVMNKPIGVITTMSDPERRVTVVKYLPDTGIAVKPVGRLDKDTSGLLMFTNDGELTMRLTHPRFGVEKEYLVTVRGALAETAVKKLRDGLWIEGGRTAPAFVHVEFIRSDGQSTVVRMRIHEGRKRQIRLMMLAVGHPVMELKRVRFGPIHLNRLPTGMCRMMTGAEVTSLRVEVGLEEGEAATPRPRRPRPGANEVPTRPDPNPKTEANPKVGRNPMKGFPDPKVNSRRRLGSDQAKGGPGGGGGNSGNTGGPAGRRGPGAKGTGSHSLAGPHGQRRGPSGKPGTGGPSDQTRRRRSAP